MKNKCLIPILTFIVTCLLFSPSVKADTTYNIQSNVFPLLDNLPTMKATADSYLSTLSSDYTGYIIYYKGTNPITTYALFFKSNPVIRYDMYNFVMMYGINDVNFNTKASYNADFTSLSTTSFLYFWPYFNYNGNSPYYILYSTVDLFPNAGAILNENLIFNYDDRSYSFYNDGTNPFPTIDDLNTYFSTPPDNTPVLTSFFTLVIDRLSYLCEEISSSYVYLSMFCVLIIYIVILLFRRLFYV